MKLRITKGRVALVVLLLPMLYVLNAGPIMYCNARFDFPSLRAINVLYRPVEFFFHGTRFWNLFHYYKWWCFDHGAGPYGAMPARVPQSK
jgi:hypothetical protein